MRAKPRLPMLRACDKATGKEVGTVHGRVHMPGRCVGVAMTCMREGAQCVVVAGSGGGHAGELLAYRLLDRGARGRWRRSMGDRPNG